MLPSKDEVSDTLSSSTIGEVIQKVDLGQKRIAFCLCMIVHVGTTNTMKIRCVPDISLKASNDYGGFYSINIFTRK